MGSPWHSRCLLPNPCRRCKGDLESHSACIDSVGRLPQICPAIANTMPRPTSNPRVAIVAFVVAAATFIVFVVLTVTPLMPLLFPVPSWFQPAGNPRKTNIIFMISDGYGPAGATLGRTLWSASNKFPPSPRRKNQMPGERGERPLTLAEIIRQRYKFDGASALPLDGILVGTSRTSSATSLVTDSAAGASAFSCVLKTYNGAIAVDSEEQPCATFFEAAHSAGWLTGLVVKSRITHATPAAFNAHVLWRDYENDIAVQQIGENPLGRSTDLMMGGGRQHFTPRNGTRPSLREDDRDLLKEAHEIYGFNVIESLQELRHGKLGLPLLALFNDSHMDYEFDRNTSSQPGLVEMTATALRLLRKSSKEDHKSRGFVLMVEGSRIDMASHSNDAATSALESLEYQATVALVRKFAHENEDTVLISTSDHETGGLSLAKQTTSQYPVYRWYPDILLNQTASTFAVGQKIHGNNFSDDAVRAILSNFLGFEKLTPGEMKIIRETEAKTLTDLALVLGGIVSRRAEVGWSTEGHSGLDVNLYAQGAAGLHGSIENTAIGKYISSVLGVRAEMEKLTGVLRANKTPYRPRPTCDESATGRDD